MEKPQSLLNRAISQSLWWASAAVVALLVAGFVGGMRYATRRKSALDQLDQSGTAQTRVPGYVPAALRSWVPEWAREVHTINVGNRVNWQAFAAFPEAERVSFQQSELTDSDLQALRRFRRLESLDLFQERGITDAGLSNLEGLPRLSELLLRDMAIGDAGLQSLGRIPNLQRVCIQMTGVTGAGLSALVSAKRLKYLNLDIDAAPAVSLDEIGQLDALEELHLTGPGITLQSVRKLALPPRLRILDLCRTEVSSLHGMEQETDIVELLAAVPGIDRLQRLDLSLNIISGETTRRICERLGMTEITPGVSAFVRLP